MATRLKFLFAWMLCFVCHLTAAETASVVPDTPEHASTIEAFRSHSAALLNSCSDTPLQANHPSTNDAMVLLKRMPIPVQQYVQSFACLCDLQELDKQVPHLEETLKGLEKTIDFYLDNYRSEVESMVLVYLSFSLFEYNMVWVWGELSAESRIDFGYIIDKFIHQAGLLANHDMEPEDLPRDWQYIIYRGLHCIAKGYPPPA